MKDFYTSDYLQDCNSEINTIDMDDESDNFVTPRENLTIADMTNHNRELECRMNKLKNTVSTLRRQLSDESEFWKNELRSQSLGDVKNDGEYYTTDDCDHESSSGSVFSSSVSLNSRKEFEKRSAGHRSALRAANEEKRNEVRRRIALAAYKEKLIEVEKMCNLELSRAKQNVRFLQPLKTMASGWSGASVRNAMSSGDAADRHVVGRRNGTENRSKVYDDRAPNDSFRGKRTF